MTHTRDPVSLSSIGQVVFEYRALKVKSMKFTSQNNVITVKHVYETCYRVSMKKNNT